MNTKPENFEELAMQVRKRTGAGLMKCRYVLEANNYDVELAVEQVGLPSNFVLVNWKRG